MPNDALDPSEAAYDAWFRSKVEDALADSRPSVPNALVEAYFARRRAAALQSENKPSAALPKP